MHDRKTQREVLALLRRGLSDYAVARQTGVTRSTVQRWRSKGLPPRRVQGPDPTWRPPYLRGYAYLLGLYLGDGCLWTNGNHAQLHLTLDATYPRLIEEAETAIGLTIPPVEIRRRGRPGCVELTAAHPLWVIAFPQHGPGKKHERKIELVDWQREITRAYPRELLRGLIHSDGCRTINRFSVDLPVGGRRTYEYARYFFSNLSADIRRIFTDHCDLLGIRWTLSNPRNVSISHRRSVVLLDDFVGAKT